MKPSASGTKRKRGSESKFYAVRVGAKPGIYHTWADCLAQVKGYKNATYKSFQSLTDAEAFLISAEASKSSTPKFYAVRNGRVPGVYTDWATAQKQITGWSKPRHKSFATRAEAEAFVAVGGPADDVPTANVDRSGGGLRAGEDEGSPPSKKPKSNVGLDMDDLDDDLEERPEAGMGPFPHDAEDGFDETVLLNPITGRLEYKNMEQMSALKTQAVPNSSKGVLRVWTDGSSLGNGQDGAVAGVGVFFGVGDRRNVSEPLTGPRQTNQRAELTAIKRALDLAPLDRDVTIYSDSNYAIQCVTSWFQKWRQNGWLTTNRKPVENRDLVEAVVDRIEERTLVKSKTEFRWLKGHADDPGNVAADALAVGGARNAMLNPHFAP